MKNEAEFKSAFKKSVKHYRGFSLTLAAPMLAGIPDLYTIIPGRVPVLLEAKWLGEIKREKFSRKVPFTELQVMWIKQVHGIAPYTALGLIGFIYNDKIHACLTSPGQTLFENFDNTFLTDASYVVFSQLEGNKSRVFDVPLLFAGVPIPRIAVTDQQAGIYVSIDTTASSALAIQ